MTSDSEFVAFVNHAIQLALNLTVNPTIWAILSILLETKDVNILCVQVMHDYYNECYNTKTEEYMTQLEQATERSKNNMYNNTPDGVSEVIQQQVCNPQMQPTNQHDVDAENCTQVPYYAHFNDILTEYPAWPTDTNGIENINQAQYNENRQDILKAWQKDTPVKTPDSRQILNNIEAYTPDRLNITQSLNHRLGLTEISLPGAQPVTVATVQSNQLTINIPNYLPNSIAKGQQDDYNYQDDREEELYQVDGTMDAQTPTGNSDDDEDNVPDNNARKRQRKIYTPADIVRKDMTKQKQADVLKSNKKEKEQNLKPKQARIQLTILTDPCHINPKVKHPTPIKLKAQKMVEEWPEDTVIRGYQMILKLTGTPKMKTS